jgi:SAM-dependent methyltransferase
VVLELGCGTGDVTRYLAPHVQHIDAVDPATAALKKARTLPNGLATNIRWINQTAEAFDFSRTYSLIFAAESLHWMAWDVIFPRIRQALSPKARLAIVLPRELDPLPWASALTPLLAKHSTNRDFQSYDLIEELTERQLFILESRIKTPPQAWSQPAADYVESFHSRNGFSRERMGEESARAFDEAVTALVTPYAQAGQLNFQLTGEIAWGLPAPR